MHVIHFIIVTQHEKFELITLILILVLLIFAVNCGPTEQILAMNNDSVMSNDSIAIPVPTIGAECSDSVQLEGCSITFSCPPGWEVNGPNSATCTGNGEWEPDPAGLMCTGK